MSPDTLRSAGKEQLESLYTRFNRREFVHPDPLEFLYDYEDPHDQEIVALIASSLAYGRVTQILNSVSIVLRHMPSPAEFVRGIGPESLRRTLGGFKHRFTTGGDLAGMLLGAKRAVEQFGSLQECFRAGLGRGDETVLPALCAFAEELNSCTGPRLSSLVPSPVKGSACKRLNLFLRWMVRRDDVDPGRWDGVPASMLVVPLDTHMHRICLKLGLTRRRQANMRTAMEVTAAFRQIVPEDPVRYDFALTRLGIRDDLEAEAWLAGPGKSSASTAAYYRLSS